MSQSNGKDNSSEIPAGAGRPTKTPLALPRGFSADQLKKLSRNVDARHIHSRVWEGRQLSYIEGWYAIAQANEVFGYAGWDREMVHFERVLERARGETAVCGYVARVRIRVRAGTRKILREGSGWGWASARTLGAAHERALKSAETDATKRALATFGPRFGLNLYDKETSRTTERKRPTLTLFAPDGRSLADNLSPEAFSSGLRHLIEACGTPDEIDTLAQNNAPAMADLRALSPYLRNTQGTHFSDLLMRLLERARRRLIIPNLGIAAPRHASPPFRDSRSPSAEIKAFPVPSENFRRVPERPRTPSNGLIISADVTATPDTKPPESIPVEIGLMSLVPTVSAEGNHTMEPIESKVSDPGSLGSPNDVAIVQSSAPRDQHHIQSAKITAPSEEPDALAPSRIALGARIDKSRLRIGGERRLRDKRHLRRVGELPCAVCNRQPTHAHHVRYAQARGMGQKVSDEYVVPLCALHHGDLHQSGSERDWWTRQGIDPLPLALELWARHRSTIK